MKLYVQTQSSCVHEERSPEQHGSWSQTYEFSVDKVSTTNLSSRGWSVGEVEQFNIDVDVAAGEQVLVMSIRWNDGDSFGNASGKGEAMWVFKDPTLAGKAKHTWEVACGWHDPSDCWRHNNKTQSVEFEVDGGRIVKVGNPCWGYFESLSAVELEQFTVQ